MYVSMYICVYLSCYLCSASVEPHKSICCSPRRPGIRGAKCWRSVTSEQRHAWHRDPRRRRGTFLAPRDPRRSHQPPVHPTNSHPGTSRAVCHYATGLPVATSRWDSFRWSLKGPVTLCGTRRRSLRAPKERLRRWRCPAWPGEATEGSGRCWCLSSRKVCPSACRAGRRRVRTVGCPSGVASLGK